MFGLVRLTPLQEKVLHQFLTSKYDFKCKGFYVGLLVFTTYLTEFILLLSVLNLISRSDSLKPQMNTRVLFKNADLQKLCSTFRSYRSYQKYFHLSHGIYNLAMKTLLKSILIHLVRMFILIFIFKANIKNIIS